MSLIGVYSSPAAELEVKSLHFNLWVLPRRKRGAVLGVIGTHGYIFYVDIGIRISVASGDVASIDIHLPGVNEVAGQELDYHDLADKVLDEKINDLIFNRKVVSGNDSIRYERNDEQIHDVVPRIKSIVGQDDASRFTINLSSRLSADSAPVTAYIRFRYKCGSVGELFATKGWGFAKRGFIFDLRANDIREGLNLPNEDQSFNMLEIGEVNAFLVHPFNMLKETEAPPSHSARLLEPKAWESYLDTCKPYGERWKMVIYQWRQKEVSHRNPMRVFAGLQSAFGVGIALAYFLGVATMPVLTKLGSILFSQAFQ